METLCDSCVLWHWFEYLLYHEWAVEMLGMCAGRGAHEWDQLRECAWGEGDISISVHKFAGLCGFPQVL